jgi:DNA repair protein RadC
MMGVEMGLLADSSAGISLDSEADGMPLGSPIEVRRTPRRKPIRCAEDRQPDLLNTLDDRDILFALLGHCLPWTQAAEAASELVKLFGGLGGAVAASDTDLAQVEALGKTGVAVLRAIHTAALRLSAAPLYDGPILNKRDSLIAYLQAAMGRAGSESARCLFLNAKNRLIADESVGAGDVRGVLVSPREIIRRALAVHATAIILVHNHPSGDTTPSQQDVSLTQEIKQAANTLGIVLHDHIIVGRGSYTSMRNLGLI